MPERLRLRLIRLHQRLVRIYNTRLRLRLVRVRQRLARIYNAIWFFPAVLLIAATILFALTGLFDRPELPVTTTGASGPGTLFVTGSPNAVRTLLSSIATGWATILGVVVSVTLLVVQLTASNYTPQVLSQFQKSRVTQLVLGAYIGVVTYSLLVLKTVRTGEGGATPFVPVVGTNLAVAWAIIDLLLLVLYIATLISFIQPHRFVESVTKSTIGAFQAALAPGRQDWLEPQEMGPSGRPIEERPDVIGSGCPRLEPEQGMGVREIRARQDGVVARVSWEDLLDAIRREMRRWLQTQPGHEGGPWRLHTEKKVGDQVGAGELLAAIEAPLPRPELDLLADWVRQSFSIEDERRPEEDAAYALIILGAIGERAATGGAPQVAVEAVNGVFVVLSRLVGLPLPAPRITGHVDGLRLLITRPTVSLHRATADAISDVVDAALRQQMSALVKEVGTRAATLLLRESRDDPGQVRHLVSDLLPIYEHVLHKLESRHTLALIINQLAYVAETLAQENRLQEARIINGALLYLLTSLQEQPEVEELLRAALDRIRPRLEPSAPAG